MREAVPFSGMLSSPSPTSSFCRRPLADTQGVSLAEAARRAILAEHERRQEAEVRPRIEDPLRVELEQMRTKLAELEQPIAWTSLRVQGVQP